MGRVIISQRVMRHNLKLQCLSVKWFGRALRMAAVVAGLSACNFFSRPPPHTAQVTPTLEVLETGLRRVVFELEVAKTERDREVGLMFRTTLPEQRGMLFVFEDEAPHTFWMKNTYLPLDLLFIDHTQTIVGIVSHAAPMSETPLGVHNGSLYVLEIGAGLAARHGIHSGQRVRIQGI